MLKSRGISAIGVATTSDAAALIEHGGVCPDLILCDYNLPGPMNGVESIKSLRAALARNLPAIVMTGDTRERTMEVVAAHGLSVLVKPFRAGELIQLMNRLCGSPASPDRNRSARAVGEVATRLVR
jgi:CheY-like chemotaxis protein